MQQGSSTTTSLHDLLPAIKSNDEQVLQHLYTTNYPAVAQYVRKNSGSDEDARDIYQEAFVAVWRNIRLDKFTESDQASLSGYIFRIAKNKWIDQLRSRKTRQVVDLGEERINGIPADQVSPETHEFLDAVKHQFGSLGARCRDLLNRFYYRRQSIRQIAAEFNWTEPTAKNNKYRCLQELRTLVKMKVQK